VGVREHARAHGSPLLRRGRARARRHRAGELPRDRCARWAELRAGADHGPAGRGHDGAAPAPLRRPRLRRSTHMTRIRTSWAVTGAVAAIALGAALALVQQRARVATEPRT